jgi:hypothetical protein
MLPGLKVLCASVLLAVAILTFALGAAALLRATHENFASVPTWRSPAETMTAFVPHPEPRHDMPTLAILQIEPSPSERDAPRDAMPSIPAKIGPVESAVAIAPPPAVTAPRIVVAALPSKADDTPPVVALPALAAVPRLPLRTGPLLMPEIAVNDAPPVNYASLDPAMFERDIAPLELAPLPRPRPSVVTLRISPRAAMRRRLLLQRRFAAVQPAKPAQNTPVPFVFPPIFNSFAP